MARRFSDKRSEAYIGALRALRALAESEGLDQATRAYGEAITEESRESYAKRRKLKKRAPGHVCVKRLLKGRCVSTFNNPCYEPNIPGQDHSSEWIKDGKPYSITFEPYGLTFETLKKLLEYCEARGLQVDIEAGSWHFPHRTLLVEIRRADSIG